MKNNPNLTEKQIGLIAHSLGVNYYNAQVSTNYKYKVLPDEFYRNYYNYGTLTDDITSLEKDGYIQFFEKFNNSCFTVTEKGIDAFRAIFQETVTNTYKPLSRSKERYQEYLEADTGLTFDEFIGIWNPKRDYKDGLIRLISSKYSHIKGDWKPTLKEAKISYKEALKADKLKYKSLQAAS